MRRRNSLHFFLAVLALPCIGCVTPPGSNPSASDGGGGQTDQVIDAKGGTFRVGDEVTVVVAEGAVDESVTLHADFATAPPLPVPPEPMVSRILALTPHGTRFSIPVRVSLRYRSNAPPSELHVLRLSNDQDTTWEPVGGVRFEGGVATFDTLTFSYYVVTTGVVCTFQDAPAAACNGISCDAQSFCSSASTCQPVGPRSLCANQELYVIQGQIPDLTVTNPEQTTDGLYAAQLASQISTACPGINVKTISQASEGLLNPCTDAPLVGNGITLLVTGGSFSQRLASYLDTGVAPLIMETSADDLQYTFKSRAGTTLVSFPRSTLNDNHDYFVVAFIRDPKHGAQVLSVYGVGWEGTPAATWYFQHRVLPSLSTLTWNRYVLVEWIDNGDGMKGEGDTFKVLAQDVP